MAVLDDLQQFFPKFAAHYLQRIIEGHIQGITFNVSVCRGIELIHPAETWIGIGTTFLAEIRGRGWQVVIIVICWKDFRNCVLQGVMIW